MSIKNLKLMARGSKRKSRIYLDYASSTPIAPEVLKVIQKAEKEVFGNPSSIHKEGVLAKKLLEESRVKIARSLECRAEELVFTSGGTESNNMAIFGAFTDDAHVITTAIEHSSVLEPIRELEKRGAAVTYLKPNSEGLINPEDVKKALRQETALVSIQYANSEIGVVQPILKIGKLLSDFQNQRELQKPKQKPKTGRQTTFKLKVAKPVFHVDASQAPMYLNCSPSHLSADLVTFDAHKMYGPKGIGLLYKRRNVNLSPIIFGGGQENELRSGTENTSAAMGFAKAFELSVALREKESERLKKLADYFYLLIRTNKRIDEDSEMTKRVVINGSLEKRLPCNINISIEGINAEFFVLQLDAAGIACSTKSSCEEGKEESYVIKSLGGPKWRAKCALRFSLGRYTQKSDIDYLARVLKNCIR
ncbi:MAG: cysteine desulfurase family protein [bacterium]|nr:cysteine desulfurase family protein [bacterium]